MIGPDCILFLVIILDKAGWVGQDSFCIGTLAQDTNTALALSVVISVKQNFWGFLFQYVLFRLKSQKGVMVAVELYLKVGDGH